MDERCKKCKTYNRTLNKSACCKWYMDNVVCGNKSVKDCTEYKYKKGTQVNNMQKVEMYHGILEAKRGMDNYIKSGWRVHTCTMGTYMAGYSCYEKVLVVYEK